MTNKYFEPIAVIGTACVAPGALSSKALWQNSANNICSIQTVPKNYWRISPESALHVDKKKDADKISSITGGYVLGFESIFNPDIFSIPKEEILKLDVLFHWLLYTAHMAFKDANYDLEKISKLKAGVILGNLSYPTTSMNELIASTWLKKQCDPLFHQLIADAPHPINRFRSGYPAHVIAKAFHLKDESYAIDAACASSLYAVKLACNKLQTEEAQLMLAGGVQAADDYFIHAGFSVLNALSKTGRSLPFQRAADGLVPGQGAGFLVLRRLKDAIQNKEPILAVIRGIGLSNSGSQTGLLKPSEAGEITAMRAAYDMADIAPKEIQFIECHATATLEGDQSELASIRKIFGEEVLTLAALKANIGHLLTASGAVALIRSIGALQQKILPGTPNAENPIEAICDSPYQLLDKSKHWHVPGGVLRRVGVNGFGMGGNNAHLILEEWDNTLSPKHHERKRLHSVPQKESIAVVGIGVIAARCNNLDEFIEIINQKTNIEKIYDVPDISLPMMGLRFPPSDLANAEGQQLAILHAGMEAMANIKQFTPEKTAVMIGMQCHVDISRFNLRWGIKTLLQEKNLAPSQQWFIDNLHKIMKPLEPSHVLGAMPNVIANRLNAQYNLQAPSFAISDEELSGITALNVAEKMLQSHEIDMAVVGAADFCCDAINQEIAEKMFAKEKQTLGDMGIVLILKRLSTAKKDQDKIFAVMDHQKRKHEITFDEQSFIPLFGYAHAASGLLSALSGIVACQEKKSVNININSFSGKSSNIQFSAYEQTEKTSQLSTELPFVNCYAANNKNELKENIKNNKTEINSSAKERLTIVANDEYQLEERKALACQMLDENSDEIVMLSKGIYYYANKIAGKVAYVFASSNTIYPNVAREILQTYPEIFNEKMTVYPQEITANAFKALYEGHFLHENFLADIELGSFVSCIHHIFCRDYLNLKFDMILGHSVGEVNAFFVLNVCADSLKYKQMAIDSKLLTHLLDKEYTVLDEEEREKCLNQDGWANYRLTGSVNKIKNKINTEKNCYLTIINTDEDCVISGYDHVCKRIIKELEMPALKLPINLLVHCEKASGASHIWAELLAKNLDKNLSYQFYSCVNGEPYTLSEKDVLNYQTRLCTETVDFPAVIKKAYEAGARIFIELGPGGLCKHWIKKILADKTHVALSLDQFGMNSMKQLIHVIANLQAAGIDIDFKKVFPWRQ